MAYRSFTKYEYYHLYNRGVDRRIIFQQKKDYQRFLLALKELNDLTHVSLSWRKRAKKEGWKIVRGDPLIRILAYTLLPNHFHIFFQVIAENDASLFLKKFGVSYTSYFNKKYERTGPLLNGRMKTAHVNKDAYFLYITQYIHLNILDLKVKQWREGTLSLSEDHKNFLFSYPWSSVGFYTHRGDDPIIDQELALELEPSTEQYKKALLNWSARALPYDLESLAK